MGMSSSKIFPHSGSDDPDKTCYEQTARIVRQLFPGKLLLELHVDSIHGGASFWNRV